MNWHIMQGDTKDIKAAKEADLIISVGVRLGLRQVGRFTESFAPKADLVRVDIDEYELSRTIKENETKYQKDASDFMRELLTEDIGDYSDWKNTCLRAKEVLDVYDKTEGNLIDMLKLLGKAVILFPIFKIYQKPMK